MQFTLTLSMDNAATTELADVADLIAEVARDVREHDGASPLGLGRHIRDVNGNRVGRWEITDDYTPQNER